jgi:DNA-binding CsgD family transcriptional regulator
VADHLRPLNEARAKQAAQRRAELIAMLAAGKSQAEIADEWGVTRQRVHALMRKAEALGELRFVEETADAAA